MIIICDICKSVDAYHEYQGKHYCDSCFSSKFHYCSECGAVVINEVVKYCNECDREYCPTCYLNTHPLCDECGETTCTRSQNRHYFGADGVICYWCRYPIWDYHKYGKSHPLKFHELDDERGEPYLGIELEMEPLVGANRAPAAEALIDLDPEDDLYHLEEDGSVRRGFELVTHPCTLAYHQQKFPWAAICKTAVGKDMRSHDTETCGLHIHLSRDFLSLSQQIKLGIFVNLQISRMERLGRRSSERYAKFKDVRETGLKKANENRKDRYEALNWENADTVEFRFPRGTLKKITILATIEFVHAVANFVKIVSTPQLVDVEKSWKLFLEFVHAQGEKYSLLEKYMQAKRLA